MLRLAPLIVRNILRNRRRSLLTLASTAISLALLALLLSIYQSFFFADQTSPSEALRLVCRHRVSLTQPLPSSHQARIQAVEGVDEVAAWSWFQGKYIDDTHFFARFAVDADKAFRVQKDWQIDPEQHAAFLRERTACVVGEAIARTENFKIGQRITILGDIYPVDLELTIVGIFKHPRNTESLIFHREYLTELLPKDTPQRDSVGTYVVLAKNVEDVPRVARVIDDMFQDSPYPTRTESEKEFNRSFLAFLGNIQLFLAAICGAVTFTILLVSANTVAMAVRERTREMAILRTLGYRPGEILNLVLGEAVLISLIGGLFGLGLGYLLSQAVSSVTGMFGIQPVQWEAALAVLLTAAIVGLCAAVVPALAASRKNIVESLRFTG